MPDDTIVQIIPALPGYWVVHRFGDEETYFPVACWALVGDDDYRSVYPVDPTGEGWDGRETEGYERIEFDPIRVTSGNTLKDRAMNNLLRLQAEERQSLNGT